MTVPPIYGLVLTGGRSSRMGRDKAALEYGGRAQADRAFDLLSGFCERTFVSARADQAELPGRAGRPQIHDVIENGGPAAGILSALRTHPDAAWLVLACDLPFLTGDVLAALVEQRDPARAATAFQSGNDGLPEPLCAIYEPAFLPVLEAFLAGGFKCPRKMLIQLGLPLLRLPHAAALDNVNEPAEFDAAAAKLQPLAVTVRYFAALREKAGLESESIQTLAPTPADLYRELSARHGFTLAAGQVRVALNGAYAPMSTPLSEGAELIFIPPVAGG
ncbi:MAG: NTP transferase domain-containing protein [Kiritimatiellia bacterium]